MDLWVLHFVIVFASGQVFTLENTERFQDYKTCMTEGEKKGPKLLEITMRLSGIPAGGKYNCRVGGSDV